jgi:ADP-ribosylglycohydrolase
MDKLQKIKGIIFGHAIADAFGVPVEFKSREYLRKNPVTQMMEYGTHYQPKGTWSDDTSMTLCTLESIAQKGDVDDEDIMKRFGWWMEQSYLTPHGELFDIGFTTQNAIWQYLYGDKYPYGSSDENSNGNGSLMRIIPVTLFHAFKKQSPVKYRDDIHNVSSLTHAHPRSVIGCGIYDFVLYELIKNPSMESVRNGLDNAYSVYKLNDEIKAYTRLFRYDFALLPESEIKSTGCVVDSLEAAIWCLLNTKSYEECVLKAVNLGSDTDTVGAIAGGLAGALYGYDSIPKEWLNSLVKKEMIEKMCEDFASTI